MIETVTLTWATGELLVSPVGLDREARERLLAAGFVSDPSLDLFAAHWTVEREDLALALHRQPDVSHDPSPFALLAGRRAEGLRRRLEQLAAGTGRSHDDLVRAGWYCQGVPQRLWRHQLRLLQAVREYERPCAAACRRSVLETALALLPDTREDKVRRARWFVGERLRFERGEMAADPLPW